MAHFSFLRVGIDEFMKADRVWPLLFILTVWLLYSFPLLYCETTWSCQRLSGDPGRRGQGSGTLCRMGCSDKIQGDSSASSSASPSAGSKQR